METRPRSVWGRFFGVIVGLAVMGGAISAASAMVVRYERRVHLLAAIAELHDIANEADQRYLVEHVNAGYHGVFISGRCIVPTSRTRGEATDLARATDEQDPMRPLRSRPAFAFEVVAPREGCEDLDPDAPSPPPGRVYTVRVALPVGEGESSAWIEADIDRLAGGELQRSPLRWAAVHGPLRDGT